MSNSQQRKMNRQVLVRLTDEDLQALKEEASRQGVSLPQWMRKISLASLVAQAS